jgi:hypothetical protein
MSSLYSYAGVARTDGVLKVCFASDTASLKSIQKRDQNADMVQLTAPMNRIDAITYLLDIDFHMVNDEVDNEVFEVLATKLEVLKDKERRARGEYKPKGRKATGEKVVAEVVLREPDPILAPHGWKKDGTPKAAPGRKPRAEAAQDAPKEDQGVTLDSIMAKGLKASEAAEVEDPSLEDAPF